MEGENAIKMEPEFRIGDTLKDDDGNTGQVVIQWNDGDRCHFINDTAHPNPVVVGNINNSVEKIDLDISGKPK